LKWKRQILEEYLSATSTIGLARQVLLPPCKSHKYRVFAFFPLVSFLESNTPHILFLFVAKKTKKRAHKHGRVAVGTEWFLGVLTRNWVKIGQLKKEFRVSKKKKWKYAV
jgi:hypothetical protein